MITQLVRLSYRPWNQNCVFGFGTHLESVLIKGCNLSKDAVAPRYHLNFMNKIVLKKEHTTQMQSPFWTASSQLVTSVFLVCKKAPNYISPTVFQHQMALGILGKAQILGCWLKTYYKNVISWIYYKFSSHELQMFAILILYFFKVSVF